MKTIEHLPLSASTEDQAMQYLAIAWNALRLALALQGTTKGELTLQLTIKGRMDTQVPKTKLELMHYHYENYEPSQSIQGMEWEETAKEFLRKLARDQHLLRLSAPSED